MQHDLIPEAKVETAKKKLQELFNLKIDMKFDAVVGNPPYQETNENTSDSPIYHLFMDVGFSISEKSSFITPARFLFNAGKTPKEWNNKILNDNHFKVISYFSSSIEVFPNVDIKGGVAITLWDNSKDFGKTGAFTSFNELNSINEKVSLSNNFASIMDIIHLQNKFVLEKLYSDFDNYKSIIGSNGRERRLTSPIFEQLDVFTDTGQSNEDIKIFGLIKNKRTHKWLNIKYLDIHPNTNKYKVLVPKANGSGKLGETLSSPFIADPKTGFTFSYISFGAFDKKEESESVLKYLKSKFIVIKNNINNNILKMR
jgi:type II restriction enzyme